MLLTKSKYMIGLQCPKCLWVMFNDPKSMPKPNENALHRFETGHIIGELAKKSFPKGVDIQTDDFKKNMDKTKKLVEQRKTMFEGGFRYGDIFSRAAVLLPEHSRWQEQFLLSIIQSRFLFSSFITFGGSLSL
ncbi:MAG: hypothetical protein ABIF08_01090 [Nanoarchaeota archaeon]